MIFISPENFGSIPRRSSSRIRPGDLDRFRALLSGGSVFNCDEDLSKRTTLRVGGTADYYFEPAHEGDLKLGLEFSRSHDLPVFILGRGSNLLIRDGGIHGMTICLFRPYFSRIELLDQELIRCGIAG